MSSLYLVELNTKVCLKLKLNLDLHTQVYTFPQHTQHNQHTSAIAIYGFAVILQDPDLSLSPHLPRLNANIVRVMTIYPGYCGRHHATSSRRHTLHSAQPLGDIFLFKPEHRSSGQLLLNPSSSLGELSMTRRPSQPLTMYKSGYFVIKCVRCNCKRPLGLELHCKISIV